MVSLQQNGFRIGASSSRSQRLSFPEVGRGKGGILMKEEGWKRKGRVVPVRFNQGFGFNGGGGGGKDESGNRRVLVNLALAIGLTYLSISGQLNWLLDALFSISLLALVLPVVGVGAFLWWAGRDMVQSSCPNCGKEFQIFKSTLNDELQLCPFCTQPFSVIDDEFVMEPIKFSNQTRTAKQTVNRFSYGSKKGNDSSARVVDVEAEIKDVD